MSGRKNRPVPCADVFSFANVNKRATRRGKEAKFYPLHGGRRKRRGRAGGREGWFVGARQRLECMPSSPASLTYDVNEEGGELLSAYVRRSSKKRKEREREGGVRDGWRHWQRRKWLLFSSGRSVGRISDVWDRSKEGGKGGEERR